MLPEDAPERLHDRETLWNEVEAVEKRKDAQPAREVEFAIPREMTNEQGVALAREFVQREFVERGLVADHHLQSGRASCWARGVPDGAVRGVGGTLKKKNT